MAPRPGGSALGVPVCSPPARTSAAQVCMESTPGARRSGPCVPSPPLGVSLGERPCPCAREAAPGQGRSRARPRGAHAVPGAPRRRRTAEGLRTHRLPQDGFFYKAVLESMVFLATRGNCESLRKLGTRQAPTNSRLLGRVLLEDVLACNLPACCCPLQMYTHVCMCVHMCAHVCAHVCVRGGDWPSGL